MVVAAFRPGTKEDFDEYPALLALAEFQPIETERLRLRLFRPEDAPVVQRLAGAYDVAKTVSNIPHPYEDGMAELWIESTLDDLQHGRALHLAITLKDDGAGELAGGPTRSVSPLAASSSAASPPAASPDTTSPPATSPSASAADSDHRPLMGAIGLEFNHQSRLAELGYWIGVPYWNKGYTTEAARALLEYGFNTLGLNRIQARHMTNNPASGRVMQKLGMTYEGTHRQATRRFGEYQDLAVYAILRGQYAGAV